MQHTPQALPAYLGKNIALVSSALILIGTSSSVIFLYGYLIPFDANLIWLISPSDIAKLSLVGISGVASLGVFLMLSMYLLHELHFSPNRRKRYIIISAPILSIIVLFIYFSPKTNIEIFLYVFSCIVIILLFLFIFSIHKVISSIENLLSLLPSGDNLSTYRYDFAFNIIMSIFAYIVTLMSSGVYFGVNKIYLSDLSINIMSEGVQYNNYGIILFTSDRIIIYNNKNIVALPSERIQVVTTPGHLFVEKNRDAPQ